MSVSKRVGLGFALALAGLGALSPASFAESEPVAPLAGSTIPDVVDENSGLNDYYSDESLGGDAEFFFSIKEADRKISKSAKRIEALYRDLLHQQDIDNPTVRTRDLPNPFSTSLFQLQAPASTNSFDSEF